MTRLEDFLDTANLAKMVAEGYISRKESGDGRVLYDYTSRCQFRRVWNNETRTCRGLVATADGDVLGRPFPKFWNLSEHANPELPPVPAEPFEVFDKLDGSLVIAYEWNRRTKVNTRGSFNSDQAVAAQAWLDERYPLGLSIPPGQTWLFEWIAPENRIVVHYERRELVLLAVVDNATGLDLPLPGDRSWPGRRVAQYHFDSLEAVAAAERDDAEGYVVRFSSGMRVKVKGSEYVRLHRILTGVSAKTIWECLSNGTGLDPVLDGVPDEFREWVQKTALMLRLGYADREGCASAEFHRIKHLGDDRKAFAAEAVKSPYRALLFAMLDGKDYSGAIWRELRPTADRPFVAEDAT